jgi:hypothetical protein
MMREQDPRLPIVRASGLYDAVLLLPFALPGVSAWTLAKMGWLNTALGLPGTIPEMSALGLLFLNMMAALAILYSVQRIREPNRFFGTYDVVARLLMGSLLGIYLLVHGIAAIFWAFFAAELFWAIAQYAAIKRSAYPPR